MATRTPYRLRVDRPSSIRAAGEGTPAGRTAAELFRDRPEAQAALLIWALTRPLGELLDPGQPAEHSRALFDEWMLGAAGRAGVPGLGLNDGAAMLGVGLVRVLLAHERALADAGRRGPRAVLERLLEDADVRDFVGVNRYRDVLWFSQERFDALVAGLLATAVVSLTVEAVAGADDVETATAAQPNLDAAHALARLLGSRRGIGVPGGAVAAAAADAHGNAQAVSKLAKRSRVGLGSRFTELIVDAADRSGWPSSGWPCSGGSRPASTRAPSRLPIRPQ